MDINGAIILIGYLIIGFITAFICNKISRKTKCRNSEPHEAVFETIFWPLDVICLIWYLIAKLYEKAGFNGRNI